MNTSKHYIIEDDYAEKEIARGSLKSLSLHFKKELAFDGNKTPKTIKGLLGSVNRFNKENRRNKFCINYSLTNA